MTGAPGKKIVYHETEIYRAIENYKDQVLDFLLYDRHEDIHMESSGR